MKRKIIKQGHNTLTLTLPSSWAKKLNIKSGDDIDISEKENTLVINSPHHNENKSCEIDIRDFTIPLLWRYFQSAYRSGCDEIKIIYDIEKKEYQDPYHYYTTQFDYAKLGEKIPPKPAITMLQEMTNRFIGMEIIESGRGYYLIQEMAEVSQKEFDRLLRRIFLVTLQLFDRTIRAIEYDEISNPSLCKELHTIDLNIDKFVDYCARILNRIDTDFPEQKKSLIFSSLFILETLGDEFKYIGKHIALSKKSIKKTARLAKLVREHFEIYYKMYYSFSREQSIEFGKKDFEVYETHFNIKDEFSGESRSIMRHLMMISKLTLGLVELRIQMEF
ncbi:MAG: AbrB/MazE/SpoVT family DNA-binding domain-containing protein [Nanoarchaeota archaeon]